MTNRTKIIIKESFKNLLIKQPAREINVSLLCREAGITRPTFYSHYNGIADLMAEIIDDIDAECNNFFNNYDIMVALEGFLRFIRQNEKIFRNLYSTKAKGDFAFLSKGLMEKALEHNKEKINKHNTAENQDAEKIEMLAMFYMAGIKELVVYWIDSDFAMPVHKLVALIKKLMDIK